MNETPEAVLTHMQQQAATLSLRCEQRFQEMTVQVGTGIISESSLFSELMLGLHQMEERATAVAQDAERQLTEVEQALLALVSQAEESHRALLPFLV